VLEEQRGCVSCYGTRAVPLLRLLLARHQGCGAVSRPPQCRPTGKEATGAAEAPLRFWRPFLPHLFETWLAPCSTQLCGDADMKPAG